MTSFVVRDTLRSVEGEVRVGEKQDEQKMAEERDPLTVELARIHARIIWRGAQRMESRIGAESVMHRFQEHQAAEQAALQLRESLGESAILLAERRADGLTELDCDLLLTIATIRLDPDAADLAVAIHEEPTARNATLDLLEILWSEDAAGRIAIRERLAPSAPLRAEGMVVVERSFADPTRIQLLPTRKTMTALLGRDPSASMETPLETPLEPDRMGIPERNLEDLLLETDTRAQIDEILSAARCRDQVLQEWGFERRYQRGLSLSALFDGEPGTGKTLAAEILAAELDLPLQRVNMAAVLDKYVGGTEKNLQKVFLEAKTSPRVLLFDEADALFSSRVQIESSQDRHANLEINLLLQLMEDYDGIVVLTTNLAQGIDKAFERRIGYKVHFPFPARELREALWRSLIPSELPLDGEIGFSDLALRFELSGGSIRNAILRAAYVAAGRSSGVSSFDLERAAEQECAASGKLYQPRTQTRGRLEI